MNKAQTRAFEQFAAELVKYIQSAECTLSATEKKEAVEIVKEFEMEFLFYVFTERAEETVNTPESLKAFKTELKTWVDRKFSPQDVIKTGLGIAEKNNVPGEQLINEFVAYIQSVVYQIPCLFFFRSLTSLQSGVEPV